MEQIQTILTQMSAKTSVDGIKNKFNTKYIAQQLEAMEDSVLTVSAMLREEYDEHGVYVGVPCIVNRNGVRKVLSLPLNEKELKQFIEVHTAEDYLNYGFTVEQIQTILTQMSAKTSKPKRCA